MHFLRSVVKSDEQSDEGSLTSGSDSAILRTHEELGRAAHSRESYFGIACLIWVDIDFHLMKIKSFDKGAIRPDRIIVGHIFINALGK